MDGGDVDRVVAARIDSQQQRDALLGQPALAVEHRRHDLGEREDAAERADRIADEAARIARAVEPLVVLDDGAHDLLRVVGEAVDAASTTSADGRRPASARRRSAAPRSRAGRARCGACRGRAAGRRTRRRGSRPCAPPPSRTRWAQSSAIRMLWSNSAGRVSRASVRWSAIGLGRRSDASASSSALPARPSGATRAKNGQRAVAARAAASSDAASTPGWRRCTRRAAARGGARGAGRTGSGRSSRRLRAA